MIRPVLEAVARIGRPDRCVPPAPEPPLPDLAAELAAYGRRHCVPCDVKWTGGTQCWCCGRPA